MQTRVDEIAERIYRLSTFLPAVGPKGFTFNQFLVDADEPLLFHCGQRSLFPAVSQAVARVMDVRRLRWIAFSHIEADECGALGEWLAAAPEATVTHGAIGCAIWLNDQAPRPPRALANEEVLDLGGRRVRRLDTPHVPHCWDAGLLYEEVTGTLFTSDLFTHVGDPTALTDGDILGPAMAAEATFGYTAVTPTTGTTIRRLAKLRPRTLAVMHGSSFAGDAAPVLESLAGFYDDLLQKGTVGARVGRARRSVRRFLLAVLGLLLICLVAAVIVFRPDKAARVATGLISHTLCSEAFVAGLDPTQTFAETFSTMPGIRRLLRVLRYQVDRAEKSVTASLADRFESRAVYAEGVGCRLVHAAMPNVAIAPPAPGLAASAAARPTSRARRWSSRPTRSCAPLWIAPSPSRTRGRVAARRRWSCSTTGASWPSAMRPATGSTRPCSGGR